MLDHRRHQKLEIDSNFPGGNIVIDKIEGSRVYLHQDLRDTPTYWFYWHFRVRGAAGRRLSFHFTRGRALGERGPAYSLDDGRRWYWLGGKTVRNNSFGFKFPLHATRVRFCFEIPYTDANLQAFLRRHRSNPYLNVESLCTTRSGRIVERLRLGCLKGNPRYRVLLTCRHHACEAMASYVLEGILRAVMGRTALGRWFQRHVEILAVPFVDKDGVEDGDQGKNRRPFDHDRDYQGRSIYESVHAIRSLVPDWSRGKPLVVFDLHCPWIHTDQGEGIYMVGLEEADMWAEQQRFGVLLETIQRGPLRYYAADNLPYGQRWNSPKNWSVGKDFIHWAQTLPGVRLASSFEIPYADARGQEMNPARARAFGEDLARALKAYLDE